MDWVKSHVHILAYLFLVVMQVVTAYYIIEEKNRAEEFDNRRDYDICVSGNTVRKAIADSFRGNAEDLINASRQAQARAGTKFTPQQEAQRVEAENDYRARIERRMEPLGPRDCEELLRTTEVSQR